MCVLASLWAMQPETEAGTAPEPTAGPPQAAAPPAAVAPLPEFFSSIGPRGLDRGGVGLELTAALGGLSAGGGFNTQGAFVAPQVELGVRLRIGRHFSVGGTAERVSGIIGGAGDDSEFERRELGLDVQWRFGGLDILKPWVGAGTAWGTVRLFHRDEDSGVQQAHVFEFLRLSAGVDVRVHPNVALGPSLRVGWGHACRSPTDCSLSTTTIGLRATAVLP